MWSSLYVAGSRVGWWLACQAQPPILFTYSFCLVYPREGELDKRRRINLHPSSSIQERRVNTNKSA